MARVAIVLVVAPKTPKADPQAHDLAQSPKVRQPASLRMVVQAFWRERVAVGLKRTKLPGSRASDLLPANTSPPARLES